jgi:hypothetical protein
LTLTVAGLDPTVGIDLTVAAARERSRRKKEPLADAEDRPQAGCEEDGAGGVKDPRADDAMEACATGSERTKEAARQWHLDGDMEIHHNSLF